MIAWTNHKYQNLEWEFQKHSYEDRKQKIINIMEYIKDKVDFAWWMQNFIIESPDISDAFLNNMYQLIMKTAVDTAQEDTTLTDIANLIAQDIALSAKVLRVANSSFYSFPQQIASINQAV